MVRQFVSYMLGPLGNQILHLYIANSLAINSIVVLYGLLLLLAHLNLRRIEAAALASLRQRLQSQVSDGRLHNHPSGSVPGFSWQEAIDQASFFPFVAHGSSLLPRRSRPSDIEKLSPVSRLIQQVTSELAPEARQERLGG